MLTIAKLGSLIVSLVCLHKTLPSISGPRNIIAKAFRLIDVIIPKDVAIPKNSFEKMNFARI